MKHHRLKIAAAGAALLLASQLPAPQADAVSRADTADQSGPASAASAQAARTLMDTYCISCHGPDRQKGDVRLDNLDTLPPDAKADLLNRVHEAIRFEEMPPPNKPQPTQAQRQQIDDWIAGVLDRAGASQIEAKLKKPEYGNYVNHEDLFSGEYADRPAFTYDRRWLISEFIFDAKMQRIVENQTTATFRGRRVTVLGAHNIRGLSLANPFLLPETSGVRYYANEDLTGGHLSTMLSNAQKTAIYITDTLVKDPRKKHYLPIVREVLALEDHHEATLIARRTFLEKNIARVCEDLYGEQNAQWLPDFVPTTLNEKKPFTAEQTKKDKRLPIPVAQNNLKKSGGWDTFEQIVLDPANHDKTDQAIADLCERAWFYRGDYERDIQGRLSILRDYISEFRERIADDKRAKLDVYKPLDEAEMAVITAGIREHREKGDRYNDIADKCLADWDAQFERARIDAGPPSDALYGRMIGELFVQVLEREPGTDEADEYLALVRGYADKLGRRKAVQKLIQTLLLTSEFAYRHEFGVGELDAHGRRMMAPRDAAYAIAYALTDQSPDDRLLEAANTGRLTTREDYEREVKRLLAQRDRYYVIDKTLADRWRQDNVTDMPVRELRFFREFFGYPKAIKIFKDEKRFGGDRLGSATNRLLAEADRVVAHILEQDRDVFEQLLTTEAFFVYHDGDNERMRARSDEIRRIYEYFKDTDWQNFEMEDLTQTHAEFLRTVDMRTIDPDKVSGNRQGNMLQLFKKSMRSIVDRMDDGQQHPAPFDLYRGYGNDFLPGYNVGKFWNHDLDSWHYEPVQPAKVPNRKGVLTHPAWLIAHAFNTETDPIHRGKWVREKLLAGTIPDVPITVDAQIPEHHDQTLRQRLAGATETEYCWKCHQHMNPLGYAFEMYDDFGRFRTEEALEYPDKLIRKGPEQKGDHLVDMRDTFETLPVDATGYLAGTGDSALDGEVSGAIDLAERLGKSRRVRQSIIRHAFRYFLGRNETLDDSGTLIDAERAYVESGGSFDAVVVCLLTSDSFIYRKAIED
ncbi:MAG: DUF1588 domain-containing protein [Phycisphaeraceae bacterium]